MSPQDNSSLKRARQSTGEVNDEPKKPRRSGRLSGPDDVKQGPFPSPITNQDTASTNGTFSPPPSDRTRETRTPPAGSPPLSQRFAGLSSPIGDTQPYSQFLTPASVNYEVEDEEGEGVWGYLVPAAGFASDTLTLRKRAACPVPLHSTGKPSGRQKVKKGEWKNQEEDYEAEKSSNGVPAGGYLIGRHPECDKIVKSATVSNRHCLVFSENKYGSTTAILEDLSGNGTYVNDQLVGRNKRRELKDGDEISIVGEATFIFRYPRKIENGSGFRQQYTIQGQLGKGHFATVFLCLEKCSGMRYAVKKFEKRSGPGEKSKVEGLQQEIAVLMGVSHPNVLCLKDTFDETDGVYLVLELAAEGELFNWIVMKQKLTEVETRKLFVQLFQGIKYLHERNIVHRDIKPENILLVDKELNIKIADFGLAKIIGEESFTTTLCGTPSYVAPEILEQTNRRRYTRAVDVWSLGVVLYICLCGFPPFSDELYSQENPYTLSQQIKMGRFDYPSPYWDSVGDPALDLIDRMLTVDVDKRITIEECLEHPWITARTINPTDSTDGLTGAISNLDFSMRKPQRERTMLASINDVKVSRVIDTQADAPPVKVWEKNSQSRFLTQRPASQSKVKKTKGHVEQTVEPAPDAARDPREFMEMGGKGDQVLFDTPQNGDSVYPDETIKAGATRGD
ncbi:Putative serine/threonine-protein kinase, active [Septoria linicola]|uniref:Serine/threonine-protein kinase, active n=1 Tax=Septoria linicola TaxID=215465 RepID=A0A9Q9ENK6_9PEZI|nr:Putative serine/threonine-protein kinase, active [Septoria linicola]